MKHAICDVCRKVAEPPVSSLHYPAELEAALEEEGINTERYICQTCAEGAVAEQQAFKEEIEPGLRNGSLCALCWEELDPPGGRSVRSVDGTQMRRLCGSCYEQVKKCRPDA